MKEQYFLDVDVFEGDFGDGMTNHTCKMITTRKESSCHYCRITTPMKSRMRLDKWLEEGEGWKSTKHCVDCLNDMVKDAGYQL